MTHQNKPLQHNPTLSTKNAITTCISVETQAENRGSLHKLLQIQERSAAAMSITAADCKHPRWDHDEDLRDYVTSQPHGKSLLPSSFSPFTVLSLRLFRVALNARQILVPLISSVKGESLSLSLSFLFFFSILKRFYLSLLLSFFLFSISSLLPSLFSSAFFPFSSTLISIPRSRRVSLSFLGSNFIQV